MVDPGVLKMAKDFGDEASEPPPDNSNYDEAVGKLREAQKVLGNPPDGLRFTTPPATATKAQLRAWADKVREASGIAWQYVEDAVPLLPKGNGGGPPVVVPPPRVTKIDCGSYPGHDPAVDGYPGEKYGVHWGVDLLAPAPGVVEIYTFPTPLEALMDADPDYERRHRDLFDGWTCSIHAFAAELGIMAGQVMAVFVYWPDQPLRVQVGDQVYTAVWLGGGHVQQSSVRTGRVDTGDRVARTWNSGIDFEAAGFPEARASHWHAIAGDTRQLSPNGDLPGLVAVRAFGFTEVVLGPKPGPQQYMSRDAQGRSAYCAGVPRASWPAGVPIPPPPAG